MNNYTYEVYVLLDVENRIIALDGGVSVSNVDKATWLKIDEGIDATKYGGCQQHYVEMPLYTMDGIPRYRWDGSMVIRRTDEEINADREIYNKPSVEEQIASLKNQLSSTDYKIIKCSEAQLLGEELPYDISSLHAERQALRDKINELEQQLEVNEKGGAI